MNTGRTRWQAVFVAYASCQYTLSFDFNMIRAHFLLSGNPNPYLNPKPMSKCVTRTKQVVVGDIVILCGISVVE